MLSSYQQVTLPSKKILLLWLRICLVISGWTPASDALLAQCSTPDELSITYSCLTGFRAAFTAVASTCVTNPQWDFGDPATGEANKDDGFIGTHTFYKPGKYTITLTATGHNGEILTRTSQISIITINFKPLWEPFCYTETYPYEINVLGSSADSRYNVTWEDPVNLPAYYTDVNFPNDWNGAFNNIYGIYKITLSAPYTCTATASYNHEPTPFLQLSHTVTATPADCSLSNGTVAIEESGGTPPYSYTWRYSTNTTATATNLPFGYYFITVKDSYGCVDNVTARVIKKEVTIRHQEDIKQPVCAANGSISVNPSGGKAPYSYVWTPAVSTLSHAEGLAAGAYNIKVKDKTGCSREFTIKLQQKADVLDVETRIAPPNCGTENGSITLLPSRGTPPYLYVWQSPLTSRDVTVDDLATGTYSATVTDANGCMGSVKTTLYEKPLTASLGNDTFLCPGKSVLLTPGAFSSYAWGGGSAQPTLAVKTPGIYSVTVTNKAGCVATTSVRVESGCGNVFFPSAFTPNGDLLNDEFGPAGTLSRLKNYMLLIYNRSGALIFRSQNPYSKWNGKTNNLPAAANTYVFVARYEIDGREEVKKGTVTLLF